MRRRAGGGDGAQQGNLRLTSDLSSRFLHALLQSRARLGALQLQSASAGLSPLLAPTQQNARLVGIVCIALSTRLPLLLALMLPPQRLFATPAFGLALRQKRGGAVLLPLPALGIEAVATTVAAQPLRRHFDNPFHAFQQRAIMADRQQPRGQHSSCS